MKYIVATMAMRASQPSTRMLGQFRIIRLTVDWGAWLTSTQHRVATVRAGGVTLQVKVPRRELAINRTSLRLSSGPRVTHRGDALALRLLTAADQHRQRLKAERRKRPGGRCR